MTDSLAALLRGRRGVRRDRHRPADGDHPGAHGAGGAALHAPAPARARRRRARGQGGARRRPRGEDVDLDKAIIDELYTPLLHLVRNAVAHGIEARRRAPRRGQGGGRHHHPAARQEAGESCSRSRTTAPASTPAAARAWRWSAGLARPGTPPDDPAVADVIFLSGVSTRADVDEVSGRGVGCDVVRREVERLGGHCASQPARRRAPPSRSPCP